MILKSMAIAIMVCVFLAGTACPVIAAPKSELWSRWERNDPASTIRLDHTRWGVFLARYVVVNHPGGINRLRYSAVTPEDRGNLSAYINQLQAVQVGSLNRLEQMAYWINLYNALTVQVILDHYPVRSIRDIDISPRFLSRGPWDAKLARIEGEKISLNDMEHRILRPVWKDNRLHYAVNCASLGCPNLQPEPFVGATMEQLLEKAATEYVNHPRGARIEGKTLILSSIYNWFQADFGTTETDVIRHLLKYARGRLAESLPVFKGRIDYKYDWALNE